MTQNGNPLIGANRGDTIDQTHDYLEWMLMQAGGSDGMHPGMIMQLRLIHGAIGSLKGGPPGEKI